MSRNVGKELTLLQ